jgi:hypothetical protein
MIRTVLLGLLVLVAAACAPVVRSAVDMAPFEARASSPPFPPGRYCSGVFEMGRATITSDESCAVLAWNAAERTYIDVRPSSDEDSTRAPMAAVRISPGLILLQSKSAEEEDSFAPFALFLFVVEGSATTAMMFSDSWTPEVMARHPRLTFASKDDVPYIAAGARADIAAFIIDVAAQSYRSHLDEAEKLQFAVRDDAGPGEHEPDARQSMDIDALRSRIRTLLLASPKS